jgi:hypothetical protein
MMNKAKTILLSWLIITSAALFAQCTPAASVAKSLAREGWSENSQTIMLELTPGKASEYTFIAQRGMSYRLVLVGGSDDFSSKYIQYQIYDKEGTYVTENGQTYYRRSSTLVHDSRTATSDEFYFITPKTRKFTVSIRSVAPQSNANANCVLFYLENKSTR